MKHLVKFNESKITPNIPTYGQLITMIENDEIKLIGQDDKDEVIEMIDGFIAWNKKKGKDVLGDLVAEPEFIRDGIVYMDFDDGFCMVAGDPPVLIYENELANPFIFGGVVICPGHDSITCYNLKTGEHVCQQIR